MGGPPPTLPNIPCSIGERHAWELKDGGAPDITAHVCRKCLLRTEIFRTPYMEARIYYYTTSIGDLWPDGELIVGGFDRTMYEFAGGTAFGMRARTEPPPAAGGRRQGRAEPDAPPRPGGPGGAAGPDCAHG